MNKLVSIIVPTLNRASIIGNTLDSILKQSYENWECIIVDDGSTDYTFELMDYYSSIDHRINFYIRPSSFKNGGNGARNYGFQLAKGAYINWFDSDDIMHPDFIKWKISRLEITGAICCISKLQLFKFTMGEMEIIKTSNVKYDNLLHDLIGEMVAIPTSNPLWNKSKLEGLELFDENLLQSQDLDFHSRIFSKHLQIEVIDKVLFYMRKGHSSITQDYFSNISVYLDSYLEVRARIISRFSNDFKLRQIICRQAMGLFRYSLSLKRYEECSLILNFVKSKLNPKGLRFQIDFLRIIILFKIFKFIGRGETRFKRFLYLSI